MASITLPKIEEKLIEKCKTYINDSGIKLIKQSIELSKNAHHGQKRLSGVDYIIHPIRVALRLSDLKLDADVIIAAILHDTLEDTNIDPNLIRKKFGSGVLELVRSVTKLSRIRINKSWFTFNRIKTTEIPEFERQMETLRRMLVAIANDVRVVLMKLADKIDNMETLKYLPADKQERIAKEVIEIYAPIAQRLGIGEWKSALEDLAFPYLYPNEYSNLRKLAIPKLNDREKYLKRITQKIKRILKSNGIEGKVDFRAKRWFSLYKKLQKYDNDLGKIHDLVAVRIIVKDVESCYATLGAIHSIWKPLFSKIKDYIALPKPNGYQSLHTTVFCDQGQIVEFQIRTYEMHYQAEFGIASHWIYADEKKSRLPNKSELSWIKDFVRIQRGIDSPVELQSILKRDFFQNRIFVFTPKGDIKDLPNGSTPIDFAYAVHSAVGNRCAGAKINGKIARISTKLQNGDIVEIIVKRNANPKPDWLGFSKTHLARTNIRHRLKEL